MSASFFQLLMPQQGLIFTALVFYFAQPYNTNVNRKEGPRKGIIPEMQTGNS